MLYGTAETFDLEDHLDGTVDTTPECNVEVHQPNQQEPSIKGNTLTYLDESTQSFVFVAIQECNNTTILTCHAFNRLLLNYYTFLLHFTREMQYAFSNFPARC